MADDYIPESKCDIEIAFGTIFSYCEDSSEEFQTFLHERPGLKKINALEQIRENLDSIQDLIDKLNKYFEDPNKVPLNECGLCCACLAVRREREATKRRKTNGH